MTNEFRTDRTETRPTNARNPGWGIPRWGWRTADITERDIRVEVTTEETTTNTVADEETSSGEVYNEADLIVPPILLKPLIGATGILTDASSDWEVISEIVPLDMGVKIRTADNGTAQMTFEDGSSLLMGGSSVINIRSFDYDEEAKARVLTVDVISGSMVHLLESEHRGHIQMGGLVRVFGPTKLTLSGKPRKL